MPRTAAVSTREALYAAGLRRFAADGWRTARVRDIVADAGQANDSAINYHFGSRMGLLEEILSRGVARMEGERRADLGRWRADLDRWHADLERRRAEMADDDERSGLARMPDLAESPGLAEAVRAVVAPLADLLLDEDGRCFLRVITQVGALTEVGRTVTAGPVAGTALQDQIEVLVVEGTRRCGAEMARHRVRQLVVMLTGELAVRAADTATADRFPPHREYVDDLVAWMATGLDRG